MFELVPVEKLKQMIGQDNGISDWVLIDQERVNSLPMPLTTINGFMWMSSKLKMVLSAVL